MSIIKDFQYTLAANQRLSINRTGNVVRCIGAGEEFNIEVYFPGKGLETLSLQAGIGVTFEQPFDYVTLINGANSNTVRVYVGDDQVDDSRQYGSVDAAITSAGNLSTTADVSAVGSTTTQIVAANANRQTLHVFNLDTTNTLRIGDSNTGASRGHPLPPLQSFTFNNFDGALYAYNPGTSSNVAILEVTTA